jgi:hypothetical protein
MNVASGLQAQTHGILFPGPGLRWPELPLAAVPGIGLTAAAWPKRMLQLLCGMRTSMECRPVLVSLLAPF